MGKGNFDDPVGNNHGVGQPFAWDFGYSNLLDPAGDNWGRILAARAGTVIDLRDGVTKVLTDSDPIWGPGNYLLVRHADDTISAYDHLKVNSIRVTVGHYVEQGTWLATVGNTGSTSGGVVHLHFECHSWWRPGKIGDPTDDAPEGASILIHFEDTAHSPWRPVDGDPLPVTHQLYRQDGWRFCDRCSGLYYAYQGASGHCPAGGSHATTGGNYTLSDDTDAPGQAGWKYCKKCAGLFYTGYPSSKCPVTTPTQEHGRQRQQRLPAREQPGERPWTASLALVHEVPGALVRRCDDVGLSRQFRRPAQPERQRGLLRRAERRGRPASVALVQQVPRIVLRAKRSGSLQGRRRTLIGRQRQLYTARRRQSGELVWNEAAERPAEYDRLARRLAILQQMRPALDGRQFGLTLPERRRP
jgi:hypothetical protein